MKIPGITFELKQVYPRLVAIEAEKDYTGADGHPCPPACKRAGHLYRHDFKNLGPGIKVFQSPNGKILVITEV